MLGVTLGSQKILRIAISQSRISACLRIIFVNAINPDFSTKRHLWYSAFMPTRKLQPPETLFADVTEQDMSMSGHQEAPDNHAHLSVQFKAMARDGLFKGQEIELQITRKIDYDITNKYTGALINSTPCPLFTVSTDTERFGHVVTLIAAKSIKELYLCFEPPKYGKAGVISWQVSTSIEK